MNALLLVLASTVLADWDTAELLQRADVVAIGTVVEQRTVVTPDGPITETRFRVEEALVGRPGPALVITQLGGRDGDVITTIDGDARLVTGRRMLLFTYRHEDGRRYLVGMALGAFFVDGDRLEQQLEAARGAGARLIPPGPRVRSLRALREVIARGASR